jgi:hypothetical protein
MAGQFSASVCQLMALFCGISQIFAFAGINQVYNKEIGTSLSLVIGCYCTWLSQTLKLGLVHV